MVKGYQFEKALIVPSGSAFSNDVQHIRSFGISIESPFSKPPAATLKTYEHFPKLMHSDAYSRSGTSTVMPTCSPKTARSNSAMCPPLKGLLQNVIVGHKEDTGSIVNNRPYQETKDCSIRFSTETKRAYRRN